MAGLHFIMLAISMGCTLDSVVLMERWSTSVEEVVPVGRQVWKPCVPVLGHVGNGLLDCEVAG